MAADTEIPNLDIIAGYEVYTKSADTSLQEGVQHPLGELFRHCMRVLCNKH